MSLVDVQMTSTGTQWTGTALQKNSLGNVYVCDSFLRVSFGSLSNTRTVAIKFGLAREVRRSEYPSGEGGCAGKAVAMARGGIYTGAHTPTGLGTFVGVSV